MTVRSGICIYTEFLKKKMGVIQRQGIKNTIITYAGIAVGFISLIFIQPNLLTPSELGLIRVLLAFSGFISTVFLLGVSNVNIRYFPFFKNPEKKHHGYFGLMLLFPLAGSIIGAIGLYVLKSFIVAQYSEQSKLFTEYFNFIFPLTVFITFTIALNSYSNALYKSTVPSFLNDIVNKILFVVVILLYYLKFVNLYQFIFCFVSIYAVQALMMLSYIFIIDSPGIKIDFSFLKTVNVSGMIKYGLLLMLTYISSISLKFLDSMMIAKFLPLAFVGIYSIAAFIATVIETPLLSMERIATAKIAYAWAHNQVDEIKIIYYKSAKYMSLLGGILLIGVIVNVYDLLFLLPEDYRQGANVAILISYSAFINMATGVNYSIIYNSSKYIYGFVFVTVLLVLTIIGNLILIPKYGIEGAAMATAFASIVYNLLKYFYIWKVFKMQPFDFSFAKIFLIMAFCFGLNYFLPSLNNHIAAIIFRSIIIAVVYGIATYFLKIVPEFHKYIPFIEEKK